MQNILSEQLQYYSNPFKGIYILNNKNTLYSSGGINPITTVSDLIQNLNTII